MDQPKAKLRHIAITVPDPHKAAAFYMEAFGMQKVGQTDHSLATGVYLTDGTVNLALLHYKTDEAAGARGCDFTGLHHIGFWVDNAHEARKQVEAAGANWWSGEVPDVKDGAFYEVKFHDPNGVVFDISTSGWVGATKEVTPRDSGDTPRPAAKAAA
jgi:methylmalonyl-CoA/ethylmalonyl-CoA epimerase